MKKLLIFMIGIVTLSCSTDELENQPSGSIPKTELASITTRYYTNGFINGTEKKNFLRNQLINIQNVNGTHTDYEYSNNLVSKVSEYNLGGDLNNTSAYSYDTTGRIIEIIRTIIQSNTTPYIAKYSFVYNSDSILITIQDAPATTYQYEFLLNQNNMVTSEKMIAINGSPLNRPAKKFEYTNDNLTAITYESGNFTSNKASSYTARKNDFNYNQYVFGDQWKMNYCLNEFSKSNSVSEALGTTSKNVPSDYLFNFKFSENEYTERSTFSYFFNDDNQIVKESISKNSAYSSSTSVTISLQESIYEYR